MPMTNRHEDIYAKQIAADTVRIQRLLPGPIERVWDWITAEDKRRQWLAGGPLELHIGGAVGLRFHHAELSDAPGTPPAQYRDMAAGHLNAGRVTECSPPRLLAYTWGENHGAASEVRFELASEGSEVRLIVTHTRLSDDAELASVSGGWHTHLDILVDRLHDRSPDNFWSAYERVAADYAQRLQQS